MYVNPFIAGVVCTLLIEAIAFVSWVYTQSNKNKDLGGKE